MYSNTKQNWFGLGPQGGINSSFSMTKNFSLFLDSKGALLYGSFRNSVIISDSHELPDFFDYATMKISDKKIIPYLNFILGGSYTFFDKNEKNHFLLRAGYELQYFISANQNIFATDQTAATRVKDDISTQGLILDLAWSF